MAWAEIHCHSLTLPISHSSDFWSNRKKVLAFYVMRTFWNQWQVSRMINSQRFQHEMGHTWNTCKRCTGFTVTWLTLSRGALPFIFTHSTCIKPHLCVRNGARHWGHREHNTVLALRVSDLKKAPKFSTQGPSRFIVQKNIYMLYIYISM